MNYINNVHKQFASYFGDRELEPYLYLLSKRLSEGQICLNLDEIDVDELREEGYGNILNNTLSNNKIISLKKEDYQPFVLENKRLYLQRYFHYENTVFERINTLVENEKNSSEQYKEELLSLKEFVKNPYQSAHAEKTDWQLVAAISSILNQFTIVTGGPGTGKTTTVALILSLLFRIRPNIKIALAAPTGKAAARMAESLKNEISSDKFQVDDEIKQKCLQIEPHTIHRLLGSQRKSIYFKHHAENPLPYDLIIIDESSMLDVALFSKLLDAIADTSKVILLGDKNQLSSVEVGSLFGDLCSVNPRLNLLSKDKADYFRRFGVQLQQENVSEPKNILSEHIIELKESHRFSSIGGIGQLSKAIIENQYAIVETFYDNADNEVEMYEVLSEKHLKEIVRIYKDYIEEEDILVALSKFKKLRILCAVKEGEEGVFAMNRKIESILKSQGLLNIDSDFYINRPVIINSNNYELGLFNGDIGIIREDKKGVKRVYFEAENESVKSVLATFLDHVDTVFAMTIHKSQGSEFDYVLVVLPKRGVPILTRELLYTAVTRAKKKVIIQGSQEVVNVSCEKQAKRGSGIASRVV